MSSQEWPTEVFRSDGEPLELTARVGEGGEGRVFHVRGHAGWAVKLPKLDGRATSFDIKKIRAMLDMARPELYDVCAWPIDVVFDTHGNPVGYLMEHLQSYTPLYSTYQVRTRRARLSGWTYRHLLRTGRNLAGCLASLHQRGIVIGDLNESNVLVSPGGRVMLIDSDSYQLLVDGALSIPEVARTEYLPPELQSGTLSGKVRTTHGDCFSMAVLLFQTLMFGRHPFAGRPTTGDEDVTIEQAITMGWFAYSLERYSPLAPPMPLSLRHAPVALQPMFEATFAPNGLRPEAITWYGAMLGLEDQLELCSEHRAHQYAKEHDACPWCELEGAWKVELFSNQALPTTDFSASVTAASLNVLFDMHQHTGILANLPLPEHFVQRPLSIRRSFSLVAKNNFAILASIFLVTYGLPIVFLFVRNFAVSAVIYLSLISIALGPHIIRNFWLRSHRKKYRAFLRQWKETASLSAIQQQQSHVMNVFNKINSLHEEMEEKRCALLKGQYPDLVARYLSRYSIAAVSSSTEDQSRIESLMRRGVTSAADISMETLVSLMPRAYSFHGTLVNWSKQLERVFWEQSHLQLPEAQERELQREHTLRQRELHSELEAEVCRYRELVDQVRRNQRDLLQLYEEVCLDVTAAMERFGMASSRELA